MFTAPPDFKVPEDIVVGDTFDEVTTYRLGDEGYLTPVAIGGVEIPEVLDEEAEEEDASIGALAMGGMDA